MEVDLSEFLKESRPKKPPCRVAVAREALESESERAQLDAACATDRGIITMGAIEKWLKARGLEVNNQSIRSHRHGTCTCHDA